MVRKPQAVHLEVLGKTPELVAMREASGHADDLVWAAYRRCAQPQRTAEDLFGGTVLDFLDGAAGSAVRYDSRDGTLLHLPRHRHKRTASRTVAVSKSRSTWPAHPGRSLAGRGILGALYFPFRFVVY